MDDQDKPAGPTDHDKLRDRIFQQQLWIEHSRTGDRDAMGRAITDLQRMTRAVGSAEASRPKQRLK